MCDTVNSVVLLIPYARRQRCLWYICDDCLQFAFSSSSFLLLPVSRCRRRRCVHLCAHIPFDKFSSGILQKCVAICYTHCQYAIIVIYERFSTRRSFSVGFSSGLKFSVCVCVRFLCHSRRDCIVRTIIRNLGLSHMVNTGNVRLYAPGLRHICHFIDRPTNRHKPKTNLLIEGHAIKLQVGPEAGWKEASIEFVWS